MWACDNDLETQARAGRTCDEVKGGSKMVVTSLRTDEGASRGKRKRSNHEWTGKCRSANMLPCITVNSSMALNMRNERAGDIRN